MPFLIEETTSFAVPREQYFKPIPKELFSDLGGFTPEGVKLNRFEQHLALISLRTLAVNGGSVWRSIAGSPYPGDENVEFGRAMIVTDSQAALTSSEAIEASVDHWISPNEATELVPGRPIITFRADHIAQAMLLVRTSL